MPALFEVLLICLLVTVSVRSNHAVVGQVSRKGSEKDGCPDTMEHPLEYFSIAKYASTNNSRSTSVTNSKCTLITQCSIDRFDNLEKQALGWNGPLSVAIYMKTTSDAHVDTQKTAIAKLLDKLNGNNEYQGHLTVSLLFGHENITWRWKCAENIVGAPLYPINALRNLATATASTPVTSTVAAMNITNANASSGNEYLMRPPPLLFLVDVDFVPSPGLLHWASRDSVVERCNRGDLIVIPAFEAKEPSSDLPTLQYMLDNIQSRNVFQFHKYFPPGHHPTNYSKWEALSAQLVGSSTHNADTYEVHYRNDYEPYVLVASQRFLAYDERLRGYGQNKIVQLRWLNMFNSTYHALPGHFVLATSHERPAVAMKAMRARTITRSSMMHAFVAACKDMHHHKKPLVSATNAVLLTAAGLGYSFQQRPL